MLTMFINSYIVAVLLMTAVLEMTKVLARSQYSWMKYDHFDEIDEIYRSVTDKNCNSKNKDQLTMRRDVVSQLPVYNQLLSKTWYRNRTSLIHIHNMALNRAFYYSYILQKMNTTETFKRQPNWLYFYFSAAADVNANPNMLNGSAVYFDRGCHYPNWYTTVPFNRTLPLFGPRAYRWDDYQDQDNMLREPTRLVVQVRDSGAGRGMNYTSPKFKMNPWYHSWLPDLKGDVDSLTKFTYHVGTMTSNRTGHFIKDTYENFAFFGPASPSASELDPRRLPVQWTAPYFDCGGSNKWVVSAVSPVVDFMPRYSNYTHLRRQRVVAVSVMDLDLVSVDFNACGLSPGNPGPSYLSGTHRCKPVTQCGHIYGYGFRRGGYVCACKPGQSYPWFVEQPYQGRDIEEATEEEFRSGFGCTRTQHQQVLPVIDNLPGVSIEGGDILTSSGGHDTSSLWRRKRSDHSWTAQSGNRDGKSSTDTLMEMGNLSSRQPSTGDRHFWSVVEDQLEGGSIKEVMSLADKLRSIRKADDHQLEEVGQLPAGGASLILQQPMGYEHARGHVDLDVETMYQRDVQQLKTLKKMLKTMNNITTTASLLRDHIRQVHVNHIKRYHASREAVASSRNKRALIFDDQSFDRMMRIFRKMSVVTSSNCHELPIHKRQLPGDVAYGAVKQFESEGRTALRLSHFLSMYLQNVLPEENFGDLQGGGRLGADQLFGEVLANVMANHRVSASGAFFDRYKFENVDGSRRELFGPWAYRKGGSFYGLDTAGLSVAYVTEDWFSNVKARFGANFQNVPLYKIRAHVRSDPNGTSSVRHEYYPMTYRAASYDLGTWTRPHFRCDGKLDSWVMTYVSPFFGLDPLRKRLEFRGVTTVDVPLHMLEINQCPQTFTVANAFKNTARCDYLSTTCIPQPGFPFMRGSYRCLCRLGFEYWHADGKFWIEGSLLELEYEKKRAGLFSRFDLLTCRVSPAAINTYSALFHVLSIIIYCCVVSVTTT